MYVIGSLAVGGAERQLVMLASALAARGLPVSVFVLEGGGPLEADLARAGVAVVHGGYDSRASFAGKLIRLARAQARLMVALLRNRPAALHAFLPFAGLLAVIAGKITRAPKIVVARRALGTHQDRHPYWRRVDRWVARHADVITANANAVAEDTVRRESVSPAKIRIIPNGIDCAKFDAAREERGATRSALGLGPDDVAFVCVANLIPYKGHRDLVEAFAIVARTEPRCRLFLVGADRGIGAALAAQAAELGISRHVTALGFRAEVAPLLSAMDLAVLASHEEGMSNALLEYLAAGLPVVATRVGGNSEILEGLPGCHLVPARDASSLAAALLDALRDVGDEAARQVRQETVTRRHSVNAMVAAHMELYGFTRGGS